MPLATLRHVFLTHQHSDHNADYGNLLLLSWAAGLKSRVDTWGPPPLAQMTKLFLEMNAFDINTRIADEGRVPLAPLVHAHEITAGGVVMQDDNVKVTAALVDHPPIEKAFAYRFDTAGSIDRDFRRHGDVEKPDRAGAGRRRAGARGVVGAGGRPAGGDGAECDDAEETHHRQPHLRRRLRQRRGEAGVKTLVLSHLVPPDDPAVTDQMWIDAAKKHFRGTVILAKT